MTHTPYTLRGALPAALALLALGASAPAQAASHGNWLYVTITQGDARSSGTRGTLLLCDPPQGHPRAVQACVELHEAGGDVARIPHKNAMCAQIYAPVRATAHGEWNGSPVAYEQTFANTCVMTARTGAVFALSG